MKITKTQLKQLIKEEANKILKEYQFGDGSVPPVVKKNYCGHDFVKKFQAFIKDAKECGFSREEFKSQANRMIDTEFDMNNF